LDLNKYVPLTIFMQYNNQSYSSHIDNFSNIFNNMEKYIESNINNQNHNNGYTNNNSVNANNGTNPLPADHSKNPKYNDFFHLGGMIKII